MNRSYLRWPFQRVAPIESQRWADSAEASQVLSGPGGIH